MTHSHAILHVSASAFEEIRAKLKAAGYDDQLHEDKIDMTGLAISPLPQAAPDAPVKVKINATSATPATHE